MSETTVKYTSPAANNVEVAEASYDLLVIGSGGAAMAAAIRARDLGKSVLAAQTFERDVARLTCCAA